METEQSDRVSIDECSPAEWDRAAKVVNHDSTLEHLEEVIQEDESQEVRMDKKIDRLMLDYAEVIEKAQKVMYAKNADYTGNSEDALANFRLSEVIGVPMEKGILLRVMDKLKRIQTFIDSGTLSVENEPVEDAIIDVINYMVLLYTATR